jgi:uncharacterized protein YjbI with pentapeptide repeats
LSFEPEEISLKLDKSLTREDVEDLLEQRGDSKNLNLSGLNLSVINFAGMNLPGAAFANAHLNGAILLNANLAKTDFHSARLNGVKGHRVRLDGADLARASLIEAELEGASFTGAFLNKTNLSGADLRKATLTGADLSEANLSEADLSQANLSQANLSQANLSRAVLRDTDLRTTDLRGAVLGGAKLDGARLDGANLSQVRLLLANLHKAQLSQAILNQTDLSWSDLAGANLRGAGLSGAKLIEADLSGADLREANLSGANLSGANLSGALLIGADLSETNLSGATLSGAYLTAAQKETLAGVLGLDETRTPQELAELEASRTAAPHPDETPLHTANGQTHPAEEGPLRLDLQASASLPSLPDFTAAPEAAAKISPRDSDATVISLPDRDLTPPPTPARPTAFQSAPLFAPAPLSTVSLVVKETPLAVGRLSRLLSDLERLHTALRFIRSEKYADLVEFYRSPATLFGPVVAGLLLKGFDLKSGQLDLTASDADAFPALHSLLAGITSPAEEVTAYELAENVLAKFASGLEAPLKAIAARPLVEFIQQLAEGPQFELPIEPSARGASGPLATD